MEDGGNPTASGKTSRTTSSTPKSSPDGSEEEGAFWAVVVSIFHQCVWVQEKDRSSGLLQSLRALLSKIQSIDRINDAPWRDDRSKEDIATMLLSYEHSNRDDDDAFLMELEQCVHQVRADATLFAQTTLPNERNHILALRHEFIDQWNTCGADRCGSPQWYTLLQTIMAHFLDQLREEESRIHRKLFPLLDSIYFKNADALKVSLQQTIHCLARTTFLERIPYLLAVEQLERNMNGSPDRFGWNSGRHLPQMKLPSLSISDATIVATTQEVDYDAVYHRIKMCTSIPLVLQDKLLSFFDSLPGVHRPKHKESAGKICAVLLLGSVGSGKTFLCDEIEQSARSLQHPSLFVIRPWLPMDVLQGRVGETEDVLVSLFEAIQQHKAMNVLVLLDNLEYIIGVSSSDLQRHFIRRCRSTFITLFDALHRMLPQQPKNVLFICTTSILEVVHATAVRFDRIIHLEPPNAMDRERLIRFYFPIAQSSIDDSASNVIDDESHLVNSVVEATVGKSYAELVQLCRQSMEMIASLDRRETDDISFNREALLAMKERLQTIIPESLRSEFVDGYVDVRVWSARDLLEKSSVSDFFSVSHEYERQMQASSSASLAWKVLKSSIIIPLCKSKELRQLLDISSEVPKSLVGAVLLTGDSGSGKSALALHCARHAATLLPSVKLMEVTCTSLVHKEVGASEQAIQQLFAAARRAAPAIVLMDSIETIAATRGNDATTEGTMDRILSTLLIELDGIDDSTGGSTVSGIAVIGITRDAAWIDPALKRPGRFDRILHLSRDWI